MSGNLSTLGFTGAAATRSITNAYSGGGVVSTNAISASATTNAAKETVSATLSANTLATVVSATGAGEVPYLTVYTTSITSQTVRAKVIVDGTTVFDATSAATTNSGAGVIVVGEFSATNFPNSSPIPLRFNTSLTVQVASSVGGGTLAVGHILFAK